MCVHIYIYIKKRRKEIPTERPGVEKNVTDASDRAFFFPSIFCVCVCCNIPRTPFSGAPVLVVVSGTLLCVSLHIFAVPTLVFYFVLLFALIPQRRRQPFPSFSVGCETLLFFNPLPEKLLFCRTLFLEPLSITATTVFFFFFSVRCTAAPS